jgi:hypothetical protein
VDSWTRYFGCAVGFGFGVAWMTMGLGAAILCLLLAGLGYLAAFTAERARANGGTLRLPSRTLPASEELEVEPELPIYEPYEPADDATSPLAAEAEYGWPMAEPEIAHTEAR